MAATMRRQVQVETILPQLCLEEHYYQEEAQAYLRISALMIAFPGVTGL